MAELWPNQYSHGDADSIAASPPFRRRACCWRYAARRSSMNSRHVIAKWSLICSLITASISSIFILYAVLNGLVCMSGSCSVGSQKIYFAFILSEYFIYISELFIAISFVNFLCRIKSNKWIGLLYWEKLFFYISISVLVFLAFAAIIFAVFFH